MNVGALLACDHVPARLKDSLLHGHAFEWTGIPPRSRRGNYQSCRDNFEIAAADVERLHDEGFLEGPLPYCPWSLTPMACIIKHEPRFKVRMVVDMLRSGINDCLLKLPCELDDLPSVVFRYKRDAYLFKFDIADAFYCWPIRVTHCDFMGITHPGTGDFYRFRYLCQGNRQCPSIQHAWARAIQAIVRSMKMK